MSLITVIMPATVVPAVRNLVSVPTITPKVSELYEVGAILYDSWGWEQTNIDFYCIIKRSGDFVTVQQMKTKSEHDSMSMTSKVVPTEIDSSKTPVRKKVYKSKESYQLGKELGFSFRDYAGGGWCSLWSGKLTTATHYA